MPMIDCFYRCYECKAKYQKRGRRCNKCGCQVQEAYYFTGEGEILVMDKISYYDIKCY